ncbi:MAG: sigma-54-dependent Fis family transcriptional regulator [Candidatus Krumholzibacteriota bacterium]|nr:sigma-54-dependent Fis family transcriptional regulator [Candidatus Krumholzibacteriota bacterium]
MKKILIVDDDAAVTNYLMVFLVQTDLFEPTVMNDSPGVEALLEKDTFDAIILDMDMPRVSGMDILSAMRGKGDDTPVVILTGVSDVDLAVKAMKLGAFDYLIKPVEDDKLLDVLERAIEQSVIEKTIDDLPQRLKREDLKHEAAFEPFLTQDPGMIRLFHHAEKIALSDLSIFIWGESGTGKETLARAIHEASSRSNNLFAAFDAGSLDPETFAPFFFGQAGDWSGSQKKNPGLLERTNHGTIFLNNIDKLTLPMQVRLKRLIQKGEYYRENSTKIMNVDVRLIVSSTQDLTSPEYQETFSRDLLYHLMVNSIRIPPMRERVADIPVLAKLFLEEEIEKTGKEIKGFSDEFLNVLKSYSFPNNVQDLRTIIESAVANETTDMIQVESLSSYIRKKIDPDMTGTAEPLASKKLDSVIRDHVLRMLELSGNDRDKAAKELGISLKKLGDILDS